MNIRLAHHYGMCFGVRDALRTVHQAASRQPVTILGQLVHNPAVDRHLQYIGVQRGSLDDLHSSSTHEVIITAHGASDRHRETWRSAGHTVTDTTCPLVHKAHHALSLLVQEHYHPVIVGQRDHVEVRGLCGDYPQSTIVLGQEDLPAIPSTPKIGIISQTTQPLDRVLTLVASIKSLHPTSEVRFIDTVCHPTKQRQTALENLCSSCQLIVVIGGNNSNNTRQLAQKAKQLGRSSYQVEGPADLDPTWFKGVHEVGVTAGTSTLDETVEAVMDRIRLIAAEQDSHPAHDFLRLVARAL